MRTGNKFGYKYDIKWSDGEVRKNLDALRRPLRARAPRGVRPSPPTRSPGRSALAARAAATTKRNSRRQAAVADAKGSDDEEMEEVDHRWARRCRCTSSLSARNATGYKGVEKTINGKFRAEHRNIKLGTFETVVDAAVAFVGCCRRSV